ncbi:hypothetical protein Deia_00344 [Candidatus Deianiraea vastatrix]|uniref:Uncharacterized protein n=1 Tax=Candidatus Deianiraea vastatrix TaxID=2163644 RepID=A0A5B8XD30_9RICK|nr:hypothetical protein Deia_00344 [Candidatus Deianiraea vastatrix]
MMTALRDFYEVIKACYDIMFDICSGNALKK